MKAVMKRKTSRPASIGREDIVKCALKMLDRSAGTTLTLRGIARELDCLLGSINYHFDNLAELEDVVTVRLLERLPVLDAARPEPLRQQLVELGLALIDAHSRHSYLLLARGPHSIELGVAQARQCWSALRTLGLPEHIAILCHEVVHSVALARGTIMLRLRNGGESAYASYEDAIRKAGKAPPYKLTAASYTPKKAEPHHRALLEEVIEALLRGFGAGSAPETSAVGRRDS